MTLATPIVILAGLYVLRNPRRHAAEIFRDSRKSFLKRPPLLLSLLVSDRKNSANEVSCIEFSDKLNSV
jgi:hypothetical protein